MNELKHNGAVVGYECATGDLAINCNSLLSCVLDFTTLPIEPGSAIIIGDVDPSTRFGMLPANCDCIAWVKSIPNAHRIELERCTWPADGVDAGTGKRIRLFFGVKLQPNPDGTSGFRREKHDLTMTLLK